MMSCHAANHTMGSLAVIPEWVVPPAQQVVDYFRISYPIVGEALSPLTGGHTAPVAVWTDLAVEPRESATDDREWATGVGAALGPEEAPS